MTDDSITRFAQKHKFVGAAALVQIIRDEDASPNARAQAAQQILAYSDGRRGPTKQVTLADVEAMTDEQRQNLLDALLTRHETEMPGQFKQLMIEAYTEALAQQQAVLPKPNKFTRGEPTPKSPHIPQPEPAIAKKPLAGPIAAPAVRSHARVVQATAGEAVEPALPLPHGHNVVPMARGTHPIIPNARVRTRRRRPDQWWRSPRRPVSLQSASRHGLRKQFLPRLPVPVASEMMCRSLRNAYWGLAPANKRPRDVRTRVSSLKKVFPATAIAATPFPQAKNALKTISRKAVGPIY